jgi:uncharacterized protein
MIESRFKFLSLLAICLVVVSGCVERGPAQATPEAAKKFLKLKGYDFDEASFFRAISEKDLLIVNGFLSAGMDPNLKNSKTGRTPLITAAAIGALPIVNALIESKADVNRKDDGGKTALFHSIEARYDEVSDVIVANPQLDLNARGKNGVTALISYVWRDRIDVVKNLLDRGADPNLQDNDGDTALHGAAQTGNVEIIEALIGKSANPNIKNSIGGTPLMWAAAYGNPEAIETLLSRNADPALKDEDGLTAVDWAKKNKRTNVLRYFNKT